MAVKKGNIKSKKGLDMNEEIKKVKEKLTDPKMKEEFRKILNKTEKGLKTFGTKLLGLAEIVKEDTVYGAKIGRLKLKQMDLESKRMKQLRSLGETVYSLIEDKKINYPAVMDLYEEILKIEKQIQVYKEEIKTVSSKLKKLQF